MWYYLCSTGTFDTVDNFFIIQLTDAQARLFVDAYYLEHIFRWFPSETVNFTVLNVLGWRRLLVVNKYTVNRGRLWARPAGSTVGLPCLRLTA